MEHRYTLERYNGMNSRYNCPICNKGKTFSRYIDTRTGDHLAYNVGRCDRESNCGNHYTPKQYFQDKGISIDTIQPKQQTNPKNVTLQPKPVSFIPGELFKVSLRSYETNHFVKFLIDIFGAKVTTPLIGRYFIGTSNHWTGSTIFWQIDTTGQIRTGKIMLYNPVTGRRVKESVNHIAWAHKALDMGEFDLKQCFFGEHLLQDTTKPVAIVESEKTAIIASIYLPQFIWLAAGSKEGLKNSEKCSILKGRKIVLFPDLKAFQDWADRARELSLIARVSVSDLLERKATEAEREQGLDLADYLVRFDYKSFISAEQPHETEPSKLETEPESAPEINPIFLTVDNTVNHEPFKSVVPAIISQPEQLSVALEDAHKMRVLPLQPSTSCNHSKWDIADLEEFLTSAVFPTGYIKLDNCSTIKDIPLFIASHLSTVKAQNGNPTYLPYFERLIQLKTILTKTDLL